MTSPHPTRHRRTRSWHLARLHPTVAATLAAMAAALVLEAPQAAAQTGTAPTATTATINIPAQPLPRALVEFARQSGLQLVYAPELVQGKQSVGVVGGKDAPAALAALLRGTGLQARQLGSTWAIERAPVAASAAETVLPVVRVSASQERETATGPVAGYVAKRSATGTKTDTPIIETPQSMSIVGAEQLEALKPQTITEALAYTAGVFRSEDYGFTRDQMRVRGFDLDAEFGSYYRDGMKYTVNGFNGQQEPYGLERIELLRGAASVLYGLSAPGGLVNTVSKRPTSTPLREMNVELGSFSRRQISGDLGDALDAEGHWSYRLTALHRNSGTFIDHLPDDRSYIAPALKWQPNAATSLTLLAEYQHDLTAYSVSLPTQGTLLTNVNGRIPRSRFVGEPGYDKFDNTRHSLGYLFEHAFANGLRLRHNLRSFHSANEFKTVYTGGDLAADGRTSTFRSADDRKDRSAALVTDTSLQIPWHQEAIEHTFLVGFDTSRLRHQSERYERSIPPSFDFFTPEYGAALGDPTPVLWSWKSNSRRYGVYAQDQAKIADRWVLMLGGRRDWVRDETCAFFDPSRCSQEKSEATTGRAGVVYLMDSGFAPFASFSQSWEPSTGTNAASERFKPTTGEQIELGLRYQPSNSPTLLSASVYQLTRQNIDVGNAAGTDTIQIGEARSRGLELEASTRIGRHANLIAAYAYTDARIVKGSPATPELDGKRTGGVPRNQLSLWIESGLGELGLPGLKLGGGMRYVDSTPGTWTDVVTPSYTLFDAMASYNTGSWRLALNVTNLADKNYVALCPYGCYYGEPRKVVATATYRW